MIDLHKITKELKNNAYRIDDICDDGAVVTSPDETEQFVLTPNGDWLRISHILLPANDVSSSKYFKLLFPSILLIQDRFIGCRFALDDDDDLIILIELLPNIITNTITIEEVIDGMDMISWVGDCVLPLFESRIK